MLRSQSSLNLGRQNKPFFTLLELLIAVAIIGILASILLPVLGNARNKAKGVVCKSNLKQMGNATLGYLKDNKKKLMPRGNGAAKTLLLDYLDVSSTSNSIFGCPSVSSSGEGLGYTNQTDGTSFLVISTPAEFILFGGVLGNSDFSSGTVENHHDENVNLLWADFSVSSRSLAEAKIASNNAP